MAMRTSTLHLALISLWLYVHLLAEPCGCIRSHPRRHTESRIVAAILAPAGNSNGLLDARDLNGSAGGSEDASASTASATSSEAHPSGPHQQHRRPKRKRASNANNRMAALTKKDLAEEQASFHHWMQQYHQEQAEYHRAQARQLAPAVDEAQLQELQQQKNVSTAAEALVGCTTFACLLYNFDLLKSDRGYVLTRQVGFGPDQAKCASLACWLEHFHVEPKTYGFELIDKKANFTTAELPSFRTASSPGAVSSSSSESASAPQQTMSAERTSGSWNTSHASGEKKKPNLDYDYLFPEYHD